MRGTFDLTIRLRNDAMREPADVVRALRSLADKLEERSEFSPGHRAVIWDENGNSVGIWSTTSLD